MKNLLKIAAVAVLAVTLTSCGAQNDPYAGNYPNNYPYPNDGTVYRAPDGTVYRQGDVYRDRTGNVYQNGRVLRTGDISGQPGILGRNGNNTVYYPNGNAKRLPPGQAKKNYGGEAKDYAPGQLKKRNRGWDDDRYKNEKKWRKENEKRYKNRDYYKRNSENSQGEDRD